MARLIYILIAVLYTNTCIAMEAKEPKVVDPGSIVWSFSVGQVNFDSPVAVQEGIEDDALYWKLGVEYQENNYIIGGGFSIFSYSDDESFSQLVEDVFGDTSREESSAEAFNLFVEGGYKFDLGSGFSLALLAGFEAVLSSERSIDFCSDCIEEDIDIESGFYVAPRITYQFSNNIVVSGTFQQHLQGDVENSVFFTIGYLYDI